MRTDGSDDYLVFPEFAWQIGKTKSSIDFVFSAKEYINRNSENKKEIEKLNKMIEDIMECKVEVFRNLTVEEFLENYKEEK